MQQHHDQQSATSSAEGTAQQKPDPITPIHLQLPATSANLGPGFDALGLALSLYLTIDATPAPAFSIDATGRNADLCASLDNNLILTTYSAILTDANAANPGSPPPLHLRLHNEIPLGMGMGSSAAALLAGVLLANHFGELHWSQQQILDEACRREGHPDNVAACLLGGMTASFLDTSEDPSHVIATTCGENLNWRFMIAVPPASLSTQTARALLPLTYTRADAVANIQSTALLVSAFARDRPDLLHFAMRDRLHQPYRSQACPLLPGLAPLAGHFGIHGVALSGAGPAVLLIVHPAAPVAQTLAAIRHASNRPDLEILDLCIAKGTIQTA